MPAKEKFSQSLRIAWAVAAKDILDAIKNRTTLSVILSVLFMVVIYRMLPSLQNGDSLPRVLVYDVGESSLVAALEGSTRINVRECDSRQQMEAFLNRGDRPELGLVIPADFDRALASDAELELEGYVLHWVNDSDANELKSLAEGEIAELMGRSVHINIDGNTIYTKKDATGYPFLATLSVIFAVTMIGVSLVPHLMLEEKKAKTLDALLVSPASIGQVVTGKTIAGMFYCLTATGIAFAFNAALINQWGLAILAVLCGSLCTVALGLLLGSGIENQGQLTLWAWVLLVPLFIPVMLSIMTDVLPAGLITAFNWIPTVALSKVLRVSFSNRAPLVQFGPELAVIVGWATLILAAVTWVVRRSDR